MINSVPLLLTQICPELLAIRRRLLVCVPALQHSSFSSILKCISVGLVAWLDSGLLVAVFASLPAVVAIPRQLWIAVQLLCIVVALFALPAIATLGHRRIPRENPCRTSPLRPFQMLFPSHGSSERCPLRVVLPLHVKFQFHPAPTPPHLAWRQ